MSINTLQALTPDYDNLIKTIALDLLAQEGKQVPAEMDAVTAKLAHYTNTVLAFELAYAADKLHDDLARLQGTVTFILSKLDKTALSTAGTKARHDTPDLYKTVLDATPQNFGSLKWDMNTVLDQLQKLESEFKKQEATAKFLDCEYKHDYNEKAIKATHMVKTWLSHGIFHDDVIVATINKKEQRYTVVGQREMCNSYSVEVIKEGRKTNEKGTRYTHIPLPLASGYVLEKHSPFHKYFDTEEVP